MHDSTASRLSQTFDAVMAAVGRGADRHEKKPPEPLRSGDVLLGGRFQVGERLGRGGMGAVYEALDRELGGHVALKALLGDNPERILRLKQEFRSLQDIQHPNLVSYGHLFEDGGRYFFTMELVRGVDFLEYTRPRGLLDASRLRAALLQLAEGLRAVHRAGFVHRDVKPSNVLVDEDDRVVLLDLGVVANVGTEGHAGSVIGTIEYMAPEQAGGQRARAAADWYAFGAVLFEALSGSLPQLGDRAQILQDKRVSPTPPSIPILDAPPDLTRLALQLLEPDPGKRPSGADVVRELASNQTPSDTSDGASIAPRPSVPFVGRRRELDALTRCYEQLAGGPTTCILAGEAGAGKTALAGEFTRGLRRTGSALVLSGRCYEHELVPFGALDAVIDRLSQYLSGLDDAERARLVPPGLRPLVNLFPVLSTAMREIVVATPTEPLELRRRAVAGLRELLRRLADRQPLVIAIDDLHWADDDSLALLSALLAPPRPPRLLLLLTSRPEGVERVRRELSGQIETVSLDGLEPEDALLLAKTLLPTNESRAREIAESSKGNPLAILELSEPDAASAASIEDVLRERIGELDATERRIVELSAISVGPAAPDVLARASGVERAALATAVRRLQSSRFLATLGAREDRRIVPFHDGVRSAALFGLDDDALAKRHRALAEALQACTPDDAEALAVHWRGAGERVPALRCVQVAAGRAAHALAFERAAQLYGWAVDVEEDEMARAQLRRLRGDALGNAGRGVEAARQYDLAAAAGDPSGELRRLAAEQLLRAGEIDQGLAALDQVLHPLGIRRPLTLGDSIKSLVTEQLRTTGLLARFDPDRPRSSRTDHPKSRQRLDACRAAAVGLGQVDPLRSAVFQLRFLRFALELGCPGQVSLGLGMQAMPASSTGPPAKRARRLLLQAAALARRTDDPMVAGHLAVNQAGVSFLTGAWQEALTHSERAIRILQDECVGAWWELATAQRFALACRWHTGQLRALREELPEVYENALVRGDRYAATQLRTTLLPVLHLLDDDPKKARRDLEDAMDSWSQRDLSLQHWQYMQSSSLVSLYEGRGRDALRSMDERIPGFGRVLMMRIMIVRIFTRAMHAAAAISAATEGGSDRRDLLRQAETDARRLEKERVVPGVARHIRAQVDYLRGDHRSAAQKLQRAYDELTEQGMGSLALATRWALGLATGGPRGERMKRHVENQLAEQGASDPARFLGMLAPAFQRR